MLQRIIDCEIQTEHTEKPFEADVNSVKSSTVNSFVPFYHLPAQDP